MLNYTATGLHGRCASRQDARKKSRLSLRESASCRGAKDDTYPRAVPYFGGAGAAATRPGDALIALSTAPSATFQTFTSPFQVPEATRLPSGLIATANTWSVCPLSVFRLAPVSGFHSFTVMSSLHVASSGSFGCCTLFRIGFACAPTALTALPPASPPAFHERSWLSAPAEKPILPAPLISPPLTLGL